MNELARKKLNRQRIFKIILTPFLIALFGGLLYRAVLYYWQQDYGTLTAVLSHLDGEAITFSEPDGVCDSSVDLSLQMHSDLPEDARIFYTLDGSDPVREGSGGYQGLSEDADVERYFAPIHLTPGTQPVTMVTVKACVQWKGESSPVQTHYYLITRDHDIYTVMQDLYTVAITAPDEALYDYDTGILADGRCHDEAVAAREDDETAPDPAGIGNWSQEGDDWIRAVHLSLFSPEGELILQQPAGLSVSGDASRQRAPVSLVLTADRAFEQAWEEGNTGIIPAVEEDPEEEEVRFSPLTLFHAAGENALSDVTEYRKLRLRSMNQAFRDIQTAFFTRIALECGFDGAAPDERSLVLLNDELHSLADLQPNYTDGWLKRRFFLPAGAVIEKYKGSETSVLTDMGVIDLVLADLRQEQNRISLEEAVDVRDLLFYYAIQILADNRDWPQRNTGAWRFSTGPENDSPYADGKIRFLLYDADHIFQVPSEVSMFNRELLPRLMETENSVFASLMQSDQYRRLFLTIVCDLLDTGFRTEHLTEIYDEIYSSYKDQLEILEMTDQDGLSELEGNVLTRREMIVHREENFRSELRFLLPEEDGELRSYRIEAPQGVTLQWGVRSLTGGTDSSAVSTAAGRYYTDCDVIITASPSPGKVWDHWIVNGQAVSQGDPALSEDGLQLDLGILMKRTEGPLLIQASVRPFDGPSLVISEVSSKDGRDWITLYNAGTAPVSLGDYQLFNTRTQAYNDLSSKKLAPGREIRLGSKQSMLTQVGGGLVTFRIRQGDGIYLLLRNSAETEEQAEEPSEEVYFPHSTVIDHVIVPRMCDGEVYCRCRDASGAVTAFHCFRIDPATQ